MLQFKIPSLWLLSKENFDILAVKTEKLCSMVCLAFALISGADMPGSQPRGFSFQDPPQGGLCN